MLTTLQVFSARLDVQVLEFVDHQHEHFVYPCSLNERGRYKVPLNPEEGYSVLLKPEAIGELSPLQSSHIL